MRSFVGGVAGQSISFSRSPRVLTPPTKYSSFEMGFSLFGCFRIHRQRYRHSCILVGPVIDGRPVADCNRRVLWLRLNKGTVETGDVGAVKAGKGMVSEVEILGRVTVPLEGNLRLVQGWVEEAFQDGENSVDAVIEAVKDHIAASDMPSTMEEIMVLDIFRATVVNRMANKVFVFRTPSSL